MRENLGLIIHLCWIWSKSISRDRKKNGRRVNVGDNVIRVMFPGTGKKRRDLDLGWGRGKIWREWEEAKWRK